MAENYLDLKFGSGSVGTITPAPNSIPKTPGGTNYINDGWLSPNIARTADIPDIGGGGGSDGLVRVPEIQVADFLAQSEHSYEVSTNAVSEGGGEGEGSGDGVASDIAITLPASPADRDRVEIFGVNDGDAWFSVNANGHAVVYPTGTTEDGVSWVFEGKGIYLLLEFRSAANGGGDQWHTVNYATKVLFGSHSTLLAEHIIRTDQDGVVKVVHQGYFAQSYGVAATVAGGGSPYAANPFELVPVDLSTGNAKVNLPGAPLAASKVLVKIKTAGAGNTCTVEAADNGDSIDWQYSNQTLSAEGDWIELYYNAVDGTWLVIG